TREYVELFDPVGKRHFRLYPWGKYVYVPARQHFAWVAPGRWEHPARQPLDFLRNAFEREKLTSSEHRAGFPRLREEFEVMGPATPSYNCIGWSLGLTESWVWPTEAGETASLHHFDAL